MSALIAWQRIPAIVADVSARTGVPERDIMSKSRARYITEARFIVYYKAHKAGLSYPMIGRRMKRDHSSVISGVRRAEYIAERDPAYAELLQ